MSWRGAGINRTQSLVLAFFLLTWAAAITILVAAPQIYDPALRRAPGSLPLAQAAFVAALSGLISVVVVGVVRRWRWLFWLILAVFVLGVLRVPVAVLQLAGHTAASPTWYVVLQGGVGLLQFAIALTMLAGYRRSGVWGAS